MADSQRKTANLFNGTLEQGSFNSNTGAEVPNSTRVRTSFFNQLKAGTYVINCNGAADAVVYLYNTNDTSSYDTATYTGWQSVPLRFNLSNDKYVRFAFRKSDNTDITPSEVSNVMLNEGSTALPYTPCWLHSLRKLTTATEAVENPLYSDGTAITAYTIKGNTVQNGTPTPSNPVAVNGVGERTENLFNTFDIVGQVPSISNGQLINYNGSTTSLIPIISGNVTVTKPPTALLYLLLYAADMSYIGYVQNSTDTNFYGSSVTGYENAKYCRLRIDRTTGLDDIQIMLNTGSTAKPFEPYGFKIPISSGGVTTNIYLGSTQTIRQISKLVLTGTENWEDRPNYTYADRFVLQSVTIPRTSTNLCTHFAVEYSSQQTYPYLWINNGEQIIINYSEKGTTTLAQFKQWLADQYTNGTPVIIYYVLATPTTGIVNEPLMKIGEYVDTLSNAASIPTTEGANSITVDTTVQPSEFTATWTGWHNAYVKEKSENLAPPISTWVSGYIDAQGNLQSASSVQQEKTTPYIEIDGSNYVCTSDFTDGTIGRWKAAAYYTADKTFISRATSYDNGSWSLSSPSNAAYIRLSFRTYGENKEIMLNTGSTALPYEPYWK